MYRKTLSSIYLAQDYSYSFEDYLEKKELIVTDLKEEDSPEKEGALNLWPKLKSTYQNHVVIEMYGMKGRNLIVPVPFLFPQISLWPDWVLIMVLAIIEHEQTKIEYEFYKKGESLPGAGNTVVRKDFKILKKMFFLYDDSILMSPSDFAGQVSQKWERTKLNRIVKDYLEDINYMKKGEDENNESPGTPISLIDNII